MPEMNLIDIFGSRAFDLVSMTDAINVIPNQFGLVNELGIFSDEGISTRTVIVEYDNLNIKLLTSKPVGAPGDANKSGKRVLKSFAVPHFPFDDTLLAEDVQGKRAFGMPAGVESAQYLMIKKLTEMRKSHDQTLEYMRCLALTTGVVKDGAGNTLLDLYTDFGVAQDSVAFLLTTNTTEVLTKCLTVKRKIELALKGSPMSGIMCLCGSNFYDALTTHANVKDAYKYWSNNNQNLAGDYRNGFRFGEILFKEYNASVSDSSGSATSLINTDEAYFFPMGSDIFKTYFSPADFMETVNTIGLPFYSKQEPMEFNRGVKVHTQSNPLPLCLRPACVVKGLKVS